MIYMNNKSGYISCKMTPVDVDSIDALVSDGAFMNRSDVIRSAVREFISNR